MLEVKLTEYVNHLQEAVEKHYEEAGYRMTPPTFDIDFGKKYAKIVRRDNQTSVHSFVVMSDKDKKFPQGSILKASSFNAPARNFPRGNVLKDGGESLKSFIYGL